MTVRPPTASRRSSSRSSSGVPPVFAFHLLTHRLVDDLPGPPVLRAGPRVTLACRPRGLALELSMAGEPLLRQASVVEGSSDGTAWFAVVAAVGEPARERDVADVIESRVDALIRTEDLERADAWRVDEKSAARQLEQLAVRRRMATARVGTANLSGRLARFTEQHVDERGLPDTRGSEDRSGRPRQKMAPQEVEPLAGPG